MLENSFLAKEFAKKDEIFFYEEDFEDVDSLDEPFSRPSIVFDIDSKEYRLVEGLYSEDDYFILESEDESITFGKEDLDDLEWVVQTMKEM
jgi:hypothetical protein